MNKKRLEEINQNLAKEYEHLVTDGITDYNQFGKSGLKILWIMKEANHTAPNSVDFRSFTKDVRVYS